MSNEIGIQPILTVLEQHPEYRPALISKLRERIMGNLDRDALYRALTLLVTIDDNAQSWLSAQLGKLDLPPALFFAMLSFVDRPPEQRQAIAESYLAKKAAAIEEETLSPEEKLKKQQEFAEAAGYLIAEMAEAEFGGSGEEETEES